MSALRYLNIVNTSAAIYLLRPQLAYLNISHTNAGNRHSHLPSSESFNIHTVVDEIVVVVKTKLVTLHTTTALSTIPRCSWEPRIIFCARNFNDAAVAITQ